MRQKINKDLIRERFYAGLTSYSNEAFVQKSMAVKLTELIKIHTPDRPLKIFESGCGTGFLTEELINNLKIGEYYANDLVPECNDYFMKITERYDIPRRFIEGDIENINFDSKYDLFTGNAVFQWLSDHNSFWKKVSTSMNKGAFIAVTLFGHDNYKEIREITGHALNYSDEVTIRESFSINYEIVNLFTENIVLKFNSGRDVLRHIRLSGTGGLAKEQWSRKKLVDFENLYKERFADTNELVSLTYQPIYLIAKIV